jgi:hypothetical protein
LFVFRSFFHDPSSGLAGVLFEVVQRTARNTPHYCANQHLSGQAERLNVGLLAISRDIQDFERSLVTLGCHYLAILRHEFLNLRHAHSFPQVSSLRYPADIQTAPLPKISGSTVISSTVQSNKTRIPPNNLYF